ncbi:MAG: YaaA family protein [Bacillota bacterium]
MRFLLSPSKTMKATKPCKGQSILFPDMRKRVLDHLKMFALDELQSYYGVNRKIAEQNYQRLQNFKETNTALYAYTGQQFKYLDAPSLKTSETDYLNDHLVILSAMYGAVRPYDCIGLYRLPMALKMDGTKLSILWRECLVPHFEGATLINLASAEYADALKGLPMITVDFLVPAKKGYKRAPAMEAKKLRGLFVRKAAQENIQDTETLKTREIGGYTYDASHSDASTYAFTKD